MTTSPILTCRRFNNDWPNTQAIQLHQAWLPAPQPEFLPGVVRTAWRDDALLVQAELSDTDIFNPSTDFNSEFYKTGDVFEVFLQPVGQAAYFEFHFGPQNQKLQLRFPKPGVVRQTGLKPEYFLTTPVLVSSVAIRSEERLWRIEAEIPFALVQEVGTVRPGTQWRFSFSRYDYTRGVKSPILSSSSPHQKLDYHRIEEWGQLTFV